MCANGVCASFCVSPINGLAALPCLGKRSAVHLLNMADASCDAQCADCLWHLLAAWLSPLSGAVSWRNYVKTGILTWQGDILPTQKEEGCEPLMSARMCLEPDPLMMHSYSLFSCQIEWHPLTDESHA